MYNINKYIFDAYIIDRSKKVQNLDFGTDIHNFVCDTITSILDYSCTQRQDLFFLCILCVWHL